MTNYLVSINTKIQVHCKTIKYNRKQSQHSYKILVNSDVTPMAEETPRYIIVPVKNHLEPLKSDTYVVFQNHYIFDVYQTHAL